MAKLLTLGLLLCLVFLAEAVDRAKFKTCDQSSFCKRNRKLVTEPQTAKFTYDWESVRVENDVFSLNLKNLDESATSLNLQISCYADNIARITVDEVNGLHKRYRVPDVLLEDLQHKPFRFEKSTKTLSFGEHNKIVFKEQVLQLDVIVDDVVTVSFNERNLFNYEVYSTKPEGEIEAGLWEENFSTHKDSKPKGPSSIGFDVTFPNSKTIFGLPEHADSMALKNTREEDGTTTSEPYRLYNLDVFEFELEERMALYGHVPLVLSHHKERSSAVFWLNAAEMWADVSQNSKQEKNVHWMSESGVLDLFVLLGPKPTDLLKQYASLTGTTALPPLFSISYHQCRWNYKDETDVHNVDSGFDQHDIPYDVLWLDIEHTDGKKYFTWDATHFPTPEKMQTEIASKGRKMVTIVDPHIKRDNNYYIHQQAQANSYYVKNSDGSAEYENWCWPVQRLSLRTTNCCEERTGSSSWPDFLDAGVREWWAKQFDYTAYQGSSDILFTWNDMNEPSVFNGPEVTMHKDALHLDGTEHRDVHNIYGLNVHKATYEGLLARNPAQDRRPFVLSRAFFAGTQRYGAIWTGDNTANWEHMASSIPMLLSLGFSGISFSGADVGGFFGNPEPELLTRWYQLGAYQPFFRAHAHLDTQRREPWLLGEPHLSAIRQVVRERYSLLPYWYTLFYENTQSGLPPMRALWLHYPQQESLWTVDDQYLVGEALLVKPVSSAGQTQTELLLPAGESVKVWYEYRRGKRLSGERAVLSTPLDKIAVAQKGGTIIPKKERARRSSTQMDKDPYTLVVALDDKKTAEGTLYIDDGFSFAYQDNHFLYKKLEFKENKLSCFSVKGDYTPSNIIERIVVLGASKPTKVSLNQEELSFDYEEANERLVVRKPGVAVAGEWSISFAFV